MKKSLARNLCVLGVSAIGLFPASAFAKNASCDSILRDEIAGQLNASSKTTFQFDANTLMEKKQVLIQSSNFALNLTIQGSTAYLSVYKGTDQLALASAPISGKWISLSSSIKGSHFAWVHCSLDSPDETAVTDSKSKTVDSAIHPFANPSSTPEAGKAK